MRFTDRKEFTYDPALFKRSDTQTALGMQAEYVKAYSAQPYPKFFEVNRSDSKVDDLWHVPLDDRTVFSRILEIPAINMFEKPEWKLTKLGLVPARRDKFWLANTHLQPAPVGFDYFPERGDLVYWNGYRYTIRDVTLDPTAYWQQTGVWLGLIVECVIAPQGDARPVSNSGEAVPRETSETRLKPEV
jgi:hypothetical protein